MRKAVPTAQTAYNTSPWLAVHPLPPTFNYYFDYI